MPKETLKNFKETKEGEEIRMNKILRNKVSVKFLLANLCSL